MSEASVGFTLASTAQPRLFSGYNPQRKGIIICNQGLGAVCLGFGSPVAFTAGVHLMSGDSFLMDGPSVYLGPIFVTPDGTTAATVSGQEWT